LVLIILPKHGKPFFLSEQATCTLQRDPSTTGFGAGVGGVFNVLMAIFS
jgi:hypothetical protein